jgi:putative ABC transport system permease protein
MARGRHARWLLIRLAAQNIGRNRWRAIFLAAAVMLGVGIGFAAFVAGSALRQGIGTSFSRMGADLVVVPRGTFVNITASLLTVQPTDATLPADLGNRIAAIPGIAAIAPQRIVPALVEGRAASLIAFDPAHDFSVLSWIEERRGGPIEGLIAGSRREGRVGETLAVCGMPMPLHGRLASTGVGPFDESYFLTFAALADVVAFCRSAQSQRAGGASLNEAQVAAAAAEHAVLCSPDLPLDRVSAFLLQLDAGAKLEDVKFALAQLPEVRIAEGNGVLTASRQGLGALLIGVIAFTVLQLVALLLVVSLLFSAIVRERERELGLLRAMGAQPNQVMAIILGEAAIITLLGGVAGLGFATAVLLTFARSLGFYLDLIGVPFTWPSRAVVQAGAIAALLFSALIGLVGAALPAWRARRRAPYALIRSEGR